MRLCHDGAGVAAVPAIDGIMRQVPVVQLVTHALLGPAQGLCGRLLHRVGRVQPAEEHDLPGRRNRGALWLSREGCRPGTCQSASSWSPAVHVRACCAGPRFYLLTLELGSIQANVRRADRCVSDTEAFSSRGWPPRALCSLIHLRLFRGALREGAAAHMSLILVCGHLLRVVSARLSMAAGCTCRSVIAALQW